MKLQAWVAAAVLCVASGNALAAGTSQTVSNWTTSFNSEVRYFSWENTHGFPTLTVPITGSGRGTQVYVPVSLTVTGAPNPDWKNELVIRGGYVNAEQTTSGSRGSVSTVLDSQISETLTYNGFNGFSPFASVLLNLPTGKSALFGNSRFARMDGDLVDVGSYGEGWNVGPTLGVNIPITAMLVATVSAGYTYRGGFLREALDPVALTVTNTDRVKNGDETTMTFALGYGNGPFNTQGTITYAIPQASQVNDPGQFNYSRYRAGNRLMFSGFMSYQWTTQWNTTIDGYYVHTNRNDVLVGVTALAAEAFNSNADVYRINATLSYMMANGITLGPVASYLKRDHNSWDALTFTFVPAKTRVSAGAFAKYNVLPTVNLNAKLERVWIHEDEFTGPPPGQPVTPVMSGTAWQALLGATITF